MYLLDKVVLPTYIQTVKSLRDCKQLSEDQLLRLTSNLVSGDVTAIEPIIRSHTKLAIYIAGQYVKASHNRGLSDELVSAALLGLTEGCNRILKGDYNLLNHVTPFLAMCAHSECSKVVGCQDLIPVPVKSNWRAGGTLNVRIEALSDTGKRVSDNMGANCRPVDTNIEMIDMIMSCAKTEFEEKLLKHRIEGRSDKQIAELLGVSRSYVQDVRSLLERRYNEKARVSESVGN